MRRAPKWIPSPGTALGLAALFVALGGTALALQANSVKSINIAPGQVKSSDLKNQGIKGKDVAKNAISAGHVENATPKLWRRVGTAGSAFGTGGGECLWSHGPETDGDFIFYPAEFYKDPVGLIHLRGLVDVNAAGPDIECFGPQSDADDGIMFTLPQGFRPGHQVLVPATNGKAPADDTAAPLTVRILPNGQVSVVEAAKVHAWNGGVSLEGIVFSTD
jgi:hypothetical protein